MTDKPTKKKELSPELGLIGRCFHTFTEDGSVQYQGIVRGDLGNGRYLIQYFDWIMGEASTLAIVPIERMIEPEGDKRAPGAWQFYENAEQMNFWYEHRYHHPKTAA